MAARTLEGTGILKSCLCHRSIVSVKRCRKKSHMASQNKLRQRRKVNKPVSQSSSTVQRSTQAQASSVSIDRRHRRPAQSLLYCCLPTTVALFALVVLLPVVVVHDVLIEGDTSVLIERSVVENVTGSPQMTGVGSYELLETVPHDSSAFTQGLVTATDLTDGSLKFLEGTGLYGQSELRLVKIPTGRVVSRHRLAPQYFGEGIAHYREGPNRTLRLIQITWMENTAFEYNLQAGISTKSLLDRFWDLLGTILSFAICWRDGRPRLCLTESNTSGLNTSPLSVQAPVSTFSFNTTKSEGWGITFSIKTNQFYVTDGSEYLHTWDGSTRKATTKVAVTYQTANDASPVPLSRLNEIEWDPVTNTVLANVWYQDIIVRIDPNSGFIRTIYNLASLYPGHPRDDVLNGIALTYDASLQVTPASGSDQIWVTGKLWPYMYRIRLIDP
jgi:glutaminyl-peptide cyclotransferase